MAELWELQGKYKTQDSVSDRSNELTTKLGGLEFGSDDFNETKGQIELLWELRSKYNWEETNQIKRVKKIEEKRFEDNLDYLKKESKQVFKNADNERDLLKINENKRKVLEDLFFLQNKYIWDEEKSKEINEEILELKKDISENAISLFKKQKKAWQKYFDSIVQSIDKSQTSVDKLKESLEDLEKKANNLVIWKDESIAKRSLEVTKEILALEEKIAKSGDTKKAGRIASWMIDIEPWDSKDLIKLSEQIAEINKLKEEQKIIEDNINLDVLAEEKRKKELSETEKILETYNIKNELIQKEKEEIKLKLDSEMIQLEEIQELKKNAEVVLTDLIVSETDKRISELDRYRQSALKLATTLKSLWFKGGVVSDTQESTQGSGTVTNNLSINLEWLEVRNDQDVVDVANLVYGRIQEETELYNKNIF